MSTSKITNAYGVPSPISPATKVCALWWEEEPIQLRARRDSEENSEPVLKVASRAVYCIEGMHDSHRMACPLYIGRAGERELPSRLSIKGSLGHFLYSSGENEPSLVYSDVWNLVVRWAEFHGSDEELDAVERLLIRFHKPAYNAKEVKGTVDGDLVVLNIGQKGTLLPVLASWYFAPMSRWPE